MLRSRQVALAAMSLSPAAMLHSRCSTYNPALDYLENEVEIVIHTPPDAWRRWTQLCALAFWPGLLFFALNWLGELLFNLSLLEHTPAPLWEGALLLAITSAVIYGPSWFLRRIWSVG